MADKKDKKEPQEPTTEKAQEQTEEKAQEQASDQPQKQVEELEAKLKQSEEKCAKEHDDYVRLYAEFDNFRRRTSQEKLELVSVASKDVIVGLLPILDDCERALKLLEDSSDEAAKEGTKLIYTKLMGYLKSKGLEPYGQKDETFDSEVHEAVAQFPATDAQGKGKIFDIIQRGYKLGGKVIRFAKVVVGI